LIVWQWVDFDDLSPRQLYRVLALRQEIFAVEQDCVYQDCDGLDPGAAHLLAHEAEVLVAYMRMIAPRADEPAVVMGRFATKRNARGRGLGKELVRRALAAAAARFPHRSVRISAQAHLQRFYEGFDFRVIGEPYLEDGIPHVAMLYSPAMSGQNETGG